MHRACEWWLFELCGNLQSLFKAQTDFVWLWLWVNIRRHRKPTQKVFFWLYWCVQTNRPSALNGANTSDLTETEMCPKHKWLENYRDFVKSLSLQCLLSLRLLGNLADVGKHCDCLPITSGELWSSHYEQNLGWI